jgi:hypothetical protein
VSTNRFVRGDSLGAILGDFERRNHEKCPHAHGQRLAGCHSGLGRDRRRGSDHRADRESGPANGTYLTPVWVGFHNGSFDVYDSGSPASAALERLAEDGNTMPISDLFTMSGAGRVQATLPSNMGIPPLAPGETASRTFDLDPRAALDRYLSFASMVIPSNDAFIGNGDPMMFELFDNAGNFQPVSFFVTGAMVRDAGAEVNTELPEHTAFFGQMMPNTGLDENGVVHTHPGFLRPGSGGILDDPQFANADFIQDGYPIAQIVVTPEPASIGLIALGGLSLLRRRVAR